LQTSPVFFWFFLPLLFFSSFTPLSIFVLLSSFSLSAPLFGSSLPSVFIEKIGRDVYYPCLIMAQG
jgi:hypothetical protein